MEQISGLSPSDNRATRGATPAMALVQIAEQLRALSVNGLHWSEDSYQTERYEKILKLAAQLLAMVDERNLPEIERIFFADLEIKTPLAVVDTAVFDAQGRLLLIQRADDRSWALPGGACDLGETPPAGGAREVWEETGYGVKITRFLGVFDSRLCGSHTSRHLYHFLFAGEVISGEATTSNETLDVRWCEPDAIPWPEVHAGHEPRIRYALEWYAHRSLPAYFDWEA